MMSAYSSSVYLPAAVAASGFNQAVVAPETQRVIDRLSRSKRAEQARQAGDGGTAQNRAAAERSRGQAAGRRWAEQTAGYSELVGLLGCVERISQAERGSGCCCGAAGELDRLLLAAAGVKDRAAEAGFVDGAKAVWAEAGSRV